MNIPSEIQGSLKEKGPNGYPNSSSARSLVEQQPQFNKHKRADKQSEYPGDTSLRQHHHLEAEIQETPAHKKKGLKPPQASARKNNLFPNEDTADKGNNLLVSDMRIETYSSIEHDDELTAKEKLRKKICKYIRLGL